MSVVTVLTLLHWPMTNHVLFVPLFYKQNLNRANEEIAQVRTKAKAESAALHAGLRKEQMKVESLERALQQKVRRGVWPQDLGFCPPQRLACGGSGWKRPRLFSQTLQSSSFLSQFRGETNKANQEIPRHIGGNCPQAGRREEVALTELQGPNAV